MQAARVQAAVGMQLPKAKITFRVSCLMHIETREHTFAKKERVKVKGEIVSNVKLK